MDYSLTIATWALAGFTAVLASATIVLVYATFKHAKHTALFAEHTRSLSALIQQHLFIENQRERRTEEEKNQKAIAELVEMAQEIENADAKDFAHTLISGHVPESTARAIKALVSHKKYIDETMNCFAHVNELRLIIEDVELNHSGPVSASEKDIERNLQSLQAVLKKWLLSGIRGDI